MLLLNIQFYKAIYLTHWLLPLTFTAVFWFGYRKLLASMEKHLNVAFQSQKLDLFETLPNYTRLLFRLSHLGFAMTLLVIFGLCGYIVKTEAPRISEVGKKFEQLRSASPRAFPKDINPTGRALTPKQDFSGSSYTWALLRLKTYDISGLDGRMSVLVPEAWDEEEALASWENPGWLRVSQSENVFMAEECAAAVSAFARNPWSGLKTFLLMTLALVGPFILSLAFGYALVSSLLGYYIERRLLKKVSVALPKKESVKMIRPFFIWVYSLIGRHCRQWPYYLESGSGKKRLAVVPLEALATSQKGYLVDTWPNLPTPSNPVLWILIFAASITGVGSIFLFLYLVPLFTKNLYFPVAAEPAARPLEATSP